MQPSYCESPKHVCEVSAGVLHRLFSMCNKGCSLGACSNTAFTLLKCRLIMSNKGSYEKASLEDGSRIPKHVIAKSNIRILPTRREAAWVLVSAVPNHREPCSTWSSCFCVDHLCSLHDECGSFRCSKYTILYKTLLLLTFSSLHNRLVAQAYILHLKALYWVWSCSTDGWCSC